MPNLTETPAALRRRVTRQVRDAMWAMQDQDGTGDLLTTIRQGLLDLGVPLLYCGVNVVDNVSDPPEVISHSMNPQGEWHKLQSVGAATVYGFWNSGEVVYRRDLAHCDPYAEHDLFPDVACIIDVPFAQGTLAASSREVNAFSDMHVEWLQDMADLLEDGFRRIAQLRAVAARRQLREQVWRMRGTADIEQVMVTLRESLNELGIHHSNSAINLVHDDQVQVHNMQRGGAWISLEESPQPLIMRLWRGGKPVYRPDVAVEDLFNERTDITTYYEKSIRSVIDVPFSHGTLALNSDRPHAFDEDQIEWLVYLAEGLEEGFRRVDDLRVLEQHNLDLQREVAERTRAEVKLASSLAEKDVLLKEVHHRVKNNLQVVSSLLSLRADSLQDATARASFSESRAQIESMAFIHERLYESPDLGHIDCGDYIVSLAEHVVSSYGAENRPIALHIDVAPLIVDVDTAIHCGLLVHELLSNSLKYAFPGWQGRHGPSILGYGGTPGHVECGRRWDRVARVFRHRLFCVAWSASGNRSGPSVAWHTTDRS
ncbi:MAG: hypothetical protein HOH74_31550 [Gemmatimonadetes bacterium]|nr:hypothetical protein [Gemmatimonadota bacterium]